MVYNVDGEWNLKMITSTKNQLCCEIELTKSYEPSVSEMARFIIYLVDTALKTLHSQLPLEQSRH